MGNYLDSYGYGAVPIQSDDGHTHAMIDPYTIDTDELVSPCNTNIRNLFLTKSNTQILIKLANNLTKYHGVHKLPALRELIPKLMPEWAERRQIERFEVSAGCVSDWFQTLEFLNRRFLDENYTAIVEFQNDPHADANLDIDFSQRKIAVENLGEPVSGLHLEVGVINEFEDTRQFRDVSRLQAADYGTLDVWAPTEIYTWDRFPIDNKYTANPEWQSGLKQYIPIQQNAGNPRRYDRSNEGLRDSKDHSERGTHLRPFNMSVFGM